MIQQNYTKNYLMLAYLLQLLHRQCLNISVSQCYKMGIVKIERSIAALIHCAIMLLTSVAGKVRTATYFVFCALLY
ncbi:hypothetical protein C9I43_10825 [Shewanella morhuae]|uniref:Secreted protein n=1 Tax=Shewanella morhuae TaxID=365591 RepID=A0ABX5HVS0_9GAMM|nr:hypothetical protein C9I43_10825 [Shewanella morhuae]